MAVGSGFGAIVRSIRDARRHLLWLACLAACLPAAAGAQDLEGWIQKLGEAAAESAAAQAPAEQRPSPAPDGSGCARLAAPGDLVLRAGGPCAAERIAEAVRTATRAMNARPATTDCRGVDACRHRVREARLRQVASLNHEEGQMARSHAKGAPANVALPPPRAPEAPSWHWTPFR